MKKNFVKKLALGLALVMAVTSVPATSEAAAKPGFKSSKVTVKEGQTKKYSTENSSKYSVKFKIGNKDVATIKYTPGSKSVKVTGVAEGKTTLRADFKSYKTKETTTVRIPVTVKAVVKPAAFSKVSQVSVTELEAVYTGDTSAIKNTDFVITRTSDNVVFPVSKVTVDQKDATKLTLTTFSKMADGKEYTVAFAGTTLSFVATQGKAASLVVDPVTVPYNTETEIHVLGKDANGVEVFDSMISNADSKLEIKVETTQGYMTGDKLVLLEKGNTAKVTATLHTYEYDTNGNEIGVIKTETTVVAVDPEVISLTGTKYTVATNLDWEKPVNTKLALKETKNLFFELKNSKDVDVTNNYTTVDSSDTNVLLVAYSTPGVATLIPVKEGTAYALVKDTDGNVVASFPITVVAERKAASMAIAPASLTLSNELADTAVAKVTVTDQYGDKMANPAAVTITEKNAPEGGDLAAPTYAAGKITATTAVDTVKGTYVYEVKYLTFTRMLTVSVQEVASASITSVYKVALDTNKVDTTITNYYDGNDVAINVSVGEYKGNVKVANTAITDITVLDAKGQPVTAAAIDLANSKIIAAKNNADTIEKYLEAGSYTVIVDFTKADGVAVKATTGFVVTDAQPGVSYTVKKNTFTGTIAGAVQDTDVVEFKYNGKAIAGTNVTYVESANITGEMTHAGIVVTVNVTVTSDVTGTAVPYTVPVTLTLNQAITLK